MGRLACLAFALGLVPSASADRKQPTDIAELVAVVTWSAAPGVDAPRFAFSTGGAHVGTDALSELRYGEDGARTSNAVIAHVTKPKRSRRAKDAEPERAVAWIAADVTILAECDDKDDCAGKLTSGDVLHATGLFEHGPDDAWRPIAMHYGLPIDAGDQARVLRKRLRLARIEAHTDVDAEPVVKLFESTLGDPKAFAKTISPRKDVVLYGAAPDERIVGGAAVRAKIEDAKLLFQLRDGLRAGVTFDKTVAWIAANVEIRSLAVEGSRSTPYRLLAIYEKTKTTWQVVQLHWSFQD